MVNQGLIAGGPLGGKKKPLPEGHCPCDSGKWKVVIDSPISDEMGSVLKRFLRFCQKKLEIKQPPVIYLLSKRTPGMTTGGYSPGDNTIMALSANRLLLDVLKTLAHELTHRMQDERGDFSDLKPRVDENDNSDLNTDYENEAYINSGNYVKEFCRLYRGEEKERLYSLHESVFSEQEAGPEDPFGQYLFGSERNKPTEIEFEPDTEEEQKLQVALGNHYGGATILLNKWIDKLVALERSGKYQEVLSVPDKYPLAWRVMTVSKETLEEILQRELTPKEDKIGRKKDMKVERSGGTFSGQFQGVKHFSWTVDPNSMREILNDWGSFIRDMNRRFLVVMRAKISDNTFLLNPDEMGQTKIVRGYGYQKEVISVGPVQCDTVWFVRVLPEPEKKYVFDGERKRLSLAKERERFGINQVVSEPLNEIPAPEASPADPFGQYLFGTERNLPSKKAPEENTDDENFLERDLNSHYMGGMTQINKWVPKLVALDKAGKYQNVLHVPEKYKLAWRAMTVKRYALEQILGRSLSDEELAEPPPGKKTPVFHQDTGTFNGKYESRVHFSWTINPGVFKKIQEDWGSLANSNMREKWLIFLQAPVASNTFLLNPDVMRKTNIPDEYGYQKEVISVGDVECNGVWFVRLGFGPNSGKKSSETVGISTVISANRKQRN